MDIEFTVDLESGDSPPSLHMANTEYLMASGFGAAWMKPYVAQPRTWSVSLQKKIRLERRGGVVSARHFDRVRRRGGCQNDSRALNWSSRPGVAASVMVPNCGVFTKRFGVPKLE